MTLPIWKGDAAPDAPIVVERKSSGFLRITQGLRFYEVLFGALFSSVHSCSHWWVSLMDPCLHWWLPALIGGICFCWWILVLVSGSHLWTSVKVMNSHRWIPVQDSTNMWPVHLSLFCEAWDLVPVGNKFDIHIGGSKRVAPSGLELG
jgi:hypothetical protein